MTNETTLSAFEKWENETHIPEDVMAVAQALAAHYGIFVEEETLALRNRGGWLCGYTKGFSFHYLTASYDEGPTPNYAPDFLRLLKGFSVVCHEEEGYDECKYECHGYEAIGYDACTTSETFEDESEYYSGDDYDDYQEENEIDALQREYYYDSMGI